MPETLGLTHPSIYSEMLKSEDSLTLELLSDKLHSVTHFGTVPDRSSEAKPFTAGAFPNPHDLQGTDKLLDQNRHARSGYSKTR
jgi:hypothetical protein